MPVSDQSQSKRRLVYIAEGQTHNLRNSVVETQNAGEALEHLLRCWFMYGFIKVSMRREWRDVDLSSATVQPSTENSGEKNSS